MKSQCWTHRNVTVVFSKALGFPPFNGSPGPICLNWIYWRSALFEGAILRNVFLQRNLVLLLQEDVADQLGLPLQLLQAGSSQLGWFQRQINGPNFWCSKLLLSGAAPQTTDVPLFAVPAMLIAACRSRELPIEV